MKLKTIKVNDETLKNIIRESVYTILSRINEDINNRKKLQNDIIQKHNPKLKDTNSLWINNEEDVLDFDEVFNEAMQEYNEYGGLTYPDMKIEDFIKAKQTNYITVYSSYPIKQGTFVTPSLMCAKDYAGGNKVYSKRVNVNDIAWLMPSEGQYANINEQ